MTSQPEFFSRYGDPVTSALREVDLKKGTALYVQPRSCGRCGGAGGSDAWKFTGWTCYECAGSGKHKNGPAVLKAYTAEKLEKLNAAQAKVTAKRVAKAQAVAAERKIKDDAEKAEFAAAYPDIISGIAKYSSACDKYEGFPEAGNFFDKMGDTLRQWNKLTERQIEAVRNAIAREDAKRATSYIGECGKRIEIEVACEKVIPIGERHFVYGQNYMFLLRDKNGNRIVYKGQSSSIPGEGQSGRIAARIEKHSEFRGEKQTFISRPKLIEA